MDIPRKLTKNTFNRLGGWVNWSSVPLRLGDIVTVEDGVMTRQGSIKDDPFNVSFKTISADAPQDLTVLAEEGTTLDFNMGGNALPGGVVPAGVTGSLQVEVNFAKESAFCFKTKEWAFEVIDNQIALSKAMKALRKAGNWDLDYCVVVQALRTSSYLLAASTESSGTVKFDAKGELHPGDVIDIGDAALGLVVASKSSSFIAMLGNGNKDAPSTVLVGLCRLRWWGDVTPKTARHSGGGRDSSTPAPSPKGELEFEEYTPDTEPL